jgi:hypothetical protein
MHVVRCYGWPVAACCPPDFKPTVSHGPCSKEWGWRKIGFRESLKNYREQRKNLSSFNNSQKLDIMQFCVSTGFCRWFAKRNCLYGQIWYMLRLSIVSTWDWYTTTVSQNLNYGIHSAHVALISILHLYWGDLKLFPIFIVDTTGQRYPKYVPS